MKALALLSGGLDSILAIKLIQEQGIKVIALSFTSPFFGNKELLTKVAKKLKIPLKIIKLDKEYLRIVRHPKHGYGKNINPCIDCKIFMLKKAKQYAKSIKAKFIFTGEVAGQRPMSQQPKTLRLIEKQAGLKGKLLRPLSAGLLPETEPEKKGWVDRNKLLAIQGRTRRLQLELAKKYKIKTYSSPGGGCLLTYREYAGKLRDLFKYKKRTNETNILLLKIGRHFRFGKSKIMVGKDEQDNKQLLKLKQKTDLAFEVHDVGSPITILQGEKTKKAIEIAARLTARYSDAKRNKVVVKYGKEKLNKEIAVKQIKDKEIKGLRI